MTGFNTYVNVIKIKTDPNFPPVTHAARNGALKERVKGELDRMEREDMIIKQEDPTPGSIPWSQL